MKKILLILSLLVFTGIANAAGIGYVDYDYVYRNLPLAKTYQNKITTKADEYKKYDKTTKTMISKEKELDKKSEIIKKRKEGSVKIQKEYIALKDEYQKVITTKIKTASDAVLVQKQLDMIVNSKVRVSGGVDCTQDVMKAIK